MNVNKQKDKQVVNQ